MACLDSQHDVRLLMKALGGCRAFAHINQAQQHMMIGAQLAQLEHHKLSASYS